MKFTGAIIFILLLFFIVMFDHYVCNNRLLWFIGDLYVISKLIKFSKYIMDEIYSDPEPDDENTF